MGTYLWLLRSRSHGSPPPERSTQKLAGCKARVTARGDEGRPPHSFRTREPGGTGSPRTARQGGAPCALRKCAAPRGFLVPGRTERKEGGLRSLQHRRESKPGEVRLGSGGLGRQVVSKSESWVCLVFCSVCARPGACSRRLLAQSEEVDPELAGQAPLQGSAKLCGPP